MSSLLERLRDTLTPDYEIVREIGRGGMGIVYLGRDTTLDRPVAIKLLKPELVTATALERFLREARLLAATRHPNIVTIHQARETNGLAYLVMDYLEGESLDERLARGPLTEQEVTRLADDVLAGLSAAHERGIVHRDVKPANVMIVVAGRFVLGDFGIAKRTESDSDPLTVPGARPGTPAYWSPEQLAGGPVTTRTDVYGVGALLFESLTGRRWQLGDLPEDAEWNGAPRRFVSLVGKALALSPEDRYRDAGAFRRALKRQEAAPTMRKVIPVAALVVGVVLVFRALWPPPAPGTSSDLALLPFETASGAESWLAQELPLMLYRHLEGGFLGEGLRVVSVGLSRRWWDSASAAGAEPGKGVWAGLRATHAAWGEVRQSGSALELRLHVVDSGGVERPVLELVRGTLSELEELGFKASLAIAQAVNPTRAGTFRGSPALRGLEVEPLREFLRAERAFDREDWEEAAAGYQRALALDSSLAPAWWGLFNALRWARQTPDWLAVIYDRYRDDFSPVERLLIEAEIAPAGPQRFERYAAAIARDPRDGYVQLLYGNELFHRGPLFGVGLDSAVRTLERATEKDPWLAPAFSTLAWALIRQGDRDPARRALDRYHTIAAPEAATGFSFAQFFEYGFAERFHVPERGVLREMLLEQTRSPEGRHQFIRLLRWAPTMGIPHAQLTFAEQLAREHDLPVEDRANLQEARGLALYHFGRAREALAAFDAAAEDFGTPAARLEAAQWRLLPHALSVLPADSTELPAARAVVAGLTDDPGVAGRARWTLAVDALGRGDLVTADRWIERLAGQTGDSMTTPLVVLAGAHRALVAGDTTAALTASAPFLAMSTANTIMGSKYPESTGTSST